MEKVMLQRGKNAIVLIGLVLTAAGLVYGFHSGIFKSQETLARFVEGCGILAGPVFVLVQIVQVIIPVIPGGISCLAGVLLFGAKWGFIYNYVGICIGSVLLFYLTRAYGRPLLLKLFDPRKVEKYEQYLNRKCFTVLFAVAIFLPVAPDDLLCALAGTTRMKARDFIWIILLGKPFAIAMYSLGLEMIWKVLLQFFH